MNIASCILVFITMIFLHIVDDFYLQGMLAELKCKEFWVKYSIENAENEDPEAFYHFMFRHDHKIALALHSFSWAFTMMLPIMLWIVACDNTSNTIWLYILSFAINVLVHALIDNYKCNCHKIGLCVDQVAHLFQITITWMLFVFYIWT